MEGAECEGGYREGAYTETLENRIVFCSISSPNALREIKAEIRRGCNSCAMPKRK
jgi:hypothetical protein